MDMITMDRINPNFLQHEGFTYLEFEGEFYKGCRRCGGDGHFSHNGEHSRCYECDNTSAKLGDRFANEDEAKKWCHQKALRRAAAERKRQREYDALVAKMEAKRAGVPEDVRSFLLGIDLNLYPEEKGYERSAFVQDMAKGLQYPAQADKPFTSKMVEAVRKVIESRAERAAVDAARPPVPTDGRQTITGKIISTKIVDGQFGTVYKVTVEDDRGFKVYGALPKAQADEAYDEFINANFEDRFSIGSGVWFLGSVNEPEKFPGVKGRRIRFDAALTQSSDDKSFGFASRPTKGAWL